MLIKGNELYGYEYITFYSANPQFSDITDEETELLKSDLTDLKSSFYSLEDLNY